MIKINALNKHFGNLHVLKDFNLTIEKGEVISLVGSSGCGKSTLLNCITGLQSEFEGTINIDNTPQNEYLKNKRIATVLQKYSNFEWLTVKENIATAFINSSLAQSKIDKAITSLIEKKGLSGFENHYMNELSGGMRQRVAIARAFAQDSEILAFDEPFGALDVENRSSLQRFFKDQVSEKKLTAIFITHDVEEAVFVADKVAVLSKAPTYVKRVFNTKKIFLNENKYSPEFISTKLEIEQLLKGTSNE